MTPDTFQPKTVLPTHTAVLVCEVRQGEMWPLGRIDLRIDEHATITSGKKNAPLMVGHLQKALAAAERECAAIAAAIEQMNHRIQELSPDP